MEELDKILGEEENETPPTPPEEEPKGEPQEEKNDEVQQEARKRLLDATKAAEEELRKIRTIRKQAKKVVSQQDDDEEDEDLPAIDLQDPSVKSWDRHLSQKVDPVNREIEMEKEEVRGLALRDFLMDKPALSKNTDKLKKVMENYHALAQGRITERNKEMVIQYLEKAFAAENHEEFRDRRHQEEVDKAKAEEAFSSVAMSRGSSAYPSPKNLTKMPVLNDDEREVIKKMGYSSPEAWWADKQKYSGGSVETKPSGVKS